MTNITIRPTIILSSNLRIKCVQDIRGKSAILLFRIKHSGGFAYLYLFSRSKFVRKEDFMGEVNNIVCDYLGLSGYYADFLEWYSV